MIDVDDTLIWLGYARRDEAVRQLQKLYNEDKYVIKRILHTGAEKRGQPKEQYLISLDQFEELMIEASTEEGKPAHKMLRQLKDAVFGFIDQEKKGAQRLLESHKTELEGHRARTADLAKQVEDLILSKMTFWLYAYRLFENRYNYWELIDENNTRILEWYKSRIFQKDVYRTGIRSGLLGKQ